MYTARDSAQATGTAGIDAITAKVLTLEGGSHLVQQGSYYSMANVDSLVFDGTNGQAITLSTDLIAEVHGDAT